MDDVVFTEYAPSDDLKDFVQAYWTGDFNQGSLAEWSRNVIPNGYIEIIIHLEDHRCVLWRNNEWKYSPRFMILGLYTKPYVVRFFQPVSVFGIRLNPEAIHQVFGIPAATFLETYESAVDVLGRAFDEVCEQVRAVKKTSQRIERVEDFLRRNLSSHFRPYDYVSYAARAIRGKSTKKMDHIRSEIPISPRQLQREFKMKLGLTPKAYLRLARMNAIQQYLSGASEVNFRKATYAYGFSDPSHLAKEFRLLTGIPPSEFMLNRKRFIVNPIPASDPLLR